MIITSKLRDKMYFLKPLFLSILFTLNITNSFSSTENIELGTAIKLSNIKKVIRLLESGISPDSYGHIEKRNFPYEDIRKSQLYLAIEFGNIEITKLLIKYKVDLNKKSLVMINKSGTKLVSPLQLSAKMNKLEIAKLLLEHNVSPNMFFNHYASALTIASHYKNFDMLKLLLKYNANPDTHGEISKYSGWITRSPLLVAIENKDIKIASYLLKEGLADICYTTPNFKLYAYRFARKSKDQRIINLVRSFHGEDCIW